MNNLFIMHTQYNLIISCGIVKNRCINDKNILVLHSEFNLNEHFKKNIEDCFDKVYYIQEKYSYERNVFRRDAKLIKYLRKSKEIYKQCYDNIYLSQENLYDTYLLSKISKHCAFNCYSVEEDVYYSVDNLRNINPPKEIKKSFLGKLRQALLNLILGKNKYYRFVYFYGQSDIYDANYVLFPEQVRKELKERKLFQITQKELYDGIYYLYKHISISRPRAGKIVLCFFDLIERYKKPEAIKAFIEYIIKYCVDNDIAFVYKYHPRETNKFDIPKEKYFLEIPSSIPAEKLLNDYKGKQVTVVGNLTTSLWVASKFGYNVISLVKLENEENLAAINALRGMGIKILNNF